MLQDTSLILRTLTCPTLVVHGSRDVLPESFAKRAAGLIENAQLVKLDSGHFIPLDQTSQVARRLLACFNSHGAKHAEDCPPDEPLAPPVRAGRMRGRPEFFPVIAPQ
jgi:hypothetical protein